MLIPLSSSQRDSPDSRGLPSNGCCHPAYEANRSTKRKVHGMRVLESSDNLPHSWATGIGTLSRAHTSREELA